MNPVNQELDACVRKWSWINSVLNSVRFMRRNTLRYCPARAHVAINDLQAMHKKFHPREQGVTGSGG